MRFSADGTKPCSICGVRKHADEYNWRDKKKGWRKPECRACQKARTAEYRVRPEVAKAKAAYKREWRARDPEWFKKDYQKNKERDAARKKAAYAANPERFKARNRRQYESNKAAHRACVKRWIEKNQERVREYAREWVKANPEKHRQKAHKRRALMLAAKVVPFTEAELAAHIESLGGRCVYCGGPYQELDHVVPLSRGGEHSLSNLRPSCTPCNRRKWAKTPEEWRSQPNT
jgi:5-methylcytosine-specific restriction endonuclease McrA